MVFRSMFRSGTKMMCELDFRDNVSMRESHSHTKETGRKADSNGCNDPDNEQYGSFTKH
jgi:hypothetical protein